jgi:PKD repeat protein
MRRFLSIALAAGTVISCRDSASPADPTPVQPDIAAAPPPQTAKYIVVYKSSVPDARAEIVRHVSPQGARVERVYQHALRGWSGDLSPAELNRLSADPHVAYIERDARVRIATTQAPTPSWGLDRIDQRPRPLNSSYTYNRTGAGVHYYGIDTGILYGHGDFGGRASAGFDAVTPGGTALDCNGHGTATASAAAGTIHGVAKAMLVVGVRVLDCNGDGTVAGAIAGVDWVTQHAIRPAVANMSLIASASAALDQAVASSIASGVVYSIAAGNNSDNACQYSPGRLPAALTVSASDANDARVSFSSFGSCTDLFAPGLNIKAAWIGSPSATTLIGGTSMAAPHVAGVAGLYLQANPAATASQVVSALVTNATQGLITNPGSGSPNRLLYMGFIGSPPPPPPPPPPGNQAPVARFTVSCPALQCTFNASTSTDDVGIVSYAWSWGDGKNDLPRPNATTMKTYAAPGTYSVRLTVTDGGGLTGSLTTPVTVPTPSGNQAPVAAISAPAAGASFGQGASVGFAGSGNDPEQGALTGGALVWTSSRDGQIGTGTSFSRSNLSVGTHTITLTARDAQNATGTATRSITITSGNQPPVASFTWACATGVPHQCTFDATGSSDDAGIVLWTWTWGDGRGHSTTSPLNKNTWASAGLFTVTLTVRDAAGLTGTISRVVTVP